MRRSFGLRLAAALAGVGVVAAAVTAILVNVAFGGRFSGYLQEQRVAQEQHLVAALADSYQRMGGWNAADLDTATPLALMDGGRLRLVDEGRIVWEAATGSLGEHMTAAYREMMGTTGRLGPEERLAVSVDGRTVGFALVRLPETGVLPQDVAFRASVNRMVVVGGIVAGLFALGIGVALARRVTAPVRQITAAARGLADGDRSRRVSFRAQDEFGEMAVAFNLMADQVEEEDRLRREFAGGVAHELRTPLSILRSQIEGIQDGIVPFEPTVASLHDEVLRMSRLVADLETMASADAVAFSLEPQLVRLDELVAHVLHGFAGSFGAAGLGMRTTLDQVTVDADPARVRQVVANLLSNAIKFTPPGGTVSVEVNRAGVEAELVVSDSGPGILPEDLPHVFERFYRGKDARAGGSGIGLAVVRELVDAHGGVVEASSEPGSGSRFAVRLRLPSRVPTRPFTATSRRPAAVGSKEGSGR